MGAGNLGTQIAQACASKVGRLTGAQMLNDVPLFSHSSVTGLPVTNAGHERAAL